MLAFIPALPFIGFLILILFGSSLSKKLVATIGAGSIGISAILMFITGATYITHKNTQAEFIQTLWIWMNVDGFNPAIAFKIDSLSLIFMFVITFVGFLIHLYSIEYMWKEEGFSRFFAYMNLFVGSMLLLVLADNLLLMYLGWEGVGLCSYLLIGFFYKDSSNGYAARKAFIVTRIGDTAMMIGLLILITTFGTLEFSKILTLAPSVWETNSSTVTLVTFLLLLGAIGKSAQLPLQVWLPDAMAGPSPVSALIHAATMVTAGVYLIARTNVLFALAPHIQMLVAIIGAATLLIAGLSALAQRDLKRVLAYSTISQIGYMFLALGVGAWGAAVFHFVIHAFFKALLFLGAGAVILSLHHEQDMFKMGGLRKKLPLVFWTFLIGSAALSALPLISAGFYSKDMILWYAFSSTEGSSWLWLVGFIGAFITATYTFRMVFVTFFGEAKTEVHYHPGILISIPLVVLAVLSIVGGFIQTPESLGHINILSNFLSPQFENPKTVHIISEGILQLFSGAITLLGISFAYILYYKPNQLAINMENSRLYKFFMSGLGFDAFYDLVIIRPFLWIASFYKKDRMDKGIEKFGKSFSKINILFQKTQNGQLNWYLTSIAIGIAIFLTLIILL